MIDLKPCPFCGKRPRIRSRFIGFGMRGWHITHRCRVRVFIGDDYNDKGKARVAKRWNTRTVPTGNKESPCV